MGGQAGAGVAGPGEEEASVVEAVTKKMYFHFRHSFFLQFFHPSLAFSCVFRFFSFAAENPLGEKRHRVREAPWTLTYL